MRYSSFQKLWAVPFFFLPLLGIEYLRVPIGNTKVPLFLLVLQLIITLQVLVKPTIQMKRFSRSNWVFIGLNFLFALLLILDGPRAIDFKYFISDVIKYVTSLLVLVMLIFWLPDKREGFFKIVEVVIFASTLLFIVYIYHYIFHLNATYLSVGWYELSEEGKNQIALFVALITPLVTWNFFAKPKVFSFAFLSLGVHLFAILYTQSRGALLTYVLSLGITLLLYHYQRKGSRNFFKIPVPFLRYSIYGLLSLLGVFFYLISFSDKSEVIQEALLAIVTFTDQGASTSIGKREEFILKCLEYFKANPFFGIGHTNFYGLEQVATHNTYLQILAEKGIVGFTVYVLIIGVVLNRIFKKKITSFYEAGIIQSNLVAILYFNFINANNSLIIFVIWALLFHSYKLNNIEHSLVRPMKSGYGTIPF